MADRSLDQIGGGFVLNGGGFVFYMMSDNLLGLTQLDYMKSSNVTFGLQIVPGSPKSREERDEKRSKKEKKSKKSSDKKKKESQKEQDQAEKSADAAKKEADKVEKAADKAEKEADKAEKALEKAEEKADKEAQKAKEDQANAEARKEAAEKALAEKAALEEQKQPEQINQTIDSAITPLVAPAVVMDSAVVNEVSEVIEKDSVLPVKVDSLPVFVGDSVPTTLKDPLSPEVIPTDSTVVEQNDQAVEMKQPIEGKEAIEVLPTDSLEVPKQEILGE